MVEVISDAGLGAIAPPAAGIVPRCVRLRDGALVWLRTAAVDDVDGVRAMFYTLSETTRYLYSGAGIPPTDAWAARTASLSVADGQSSYAVVAVVGSQVVGVARFVRIRNGNAAEIGILLTDAWQSRGLGPEVVACLRAEAESWGLAGFTATVLGENRRAVRFLRRAFPDLRADWAYGQFVFDLPFTRATSVGSER